MIDTSSITAENLNPGLISVTGRWWCRHGCIAAAFGDFRKSGVSPTQKGFRRFLSAYSLQHRLFAVHEGQGLLSAGGLQLTWLDIVPENPITIRLDRLAAFEESLAVNIRFIRRIPMTGAGAWHAAVLSGRGHAILATLGPPHHLEERHLPGGWIDADFDADAVAAWSGTLSPTFAVHKLTWTTLLSPSGYREARLRFTGSGSVWLDAGAIALPFYQPALRRGVEKQRSL